MLEKDNEIIITKEYVENCFNKVKELAIEKKVMYDTMKERVQEVFDVWRRYNNVRPNEVSTWFFQPFTSKPTFRVMVDSNRFNYILPLELLYCEDVEAYCKENYK